MNCHKAQLKMGDRLVNSLSDADIKAMDQHLDSCETCRKLWAEECKLWGITGNYPDPPKVSAEFTANVLQNLKAEAEPEVDAGKIIDFPVRKRRWIPVAVAAGLGILLTGAYLVRFSGIEESVQVADVQPAQEITDEMIIANLDLLEELELFENLEFYEDLDVIEALAVN